MLKKMMWGSVVLGEAVWYYRKCGDKISWKGDFVTFFKCMGAEQIAYMMDNL